MSEADAPLVSILLPTHNRADLLPFAIRSVLAQSVQDFELLIVGDGCTDGTAQVVKGFADARIVWFDLPKAPNFGYANRNVALRQARGTYVAFMAHDDLWLPDHLELLLPFLEQPGIELVYSRPLWVIPKGKIAPAVFDLDDALTLEKFLSKTESRIPAVCVVHRRECFAKYGYWDESLPTRGDWDMWARIIAGGGRMNFAYLPEPTCLHFRPDWRQKLNYVLAYELVWEQFYALDGFVPASMKIPIPDEMSEQEAAWQAMSAQPREWSRQLRAAIRLAFDRRVEHSDGLIAWMIWHWPNLGYDTQSLIGQLAGLLERQALLESELLSAKEQVVRLSNSQPGQHDILLVEGSLAWKLLRALRAARLWLIPPGTRRERIWLYLGARLLGK